MLTVSENQAKKPIVASGRLDLRRDFPAADTPYCGQPGTRRNMDGPDNHGNEISFDRDNIHGVARPIFLAEPGTQHRSIASKEIHGAELLDIGRHERWRRLLEAAPLDFFC
ncbi:MAG: hypothetical protein ABSC32_19875 [Steroidobacteraceae bacterium]